jgi:FkbM family methyltransferase
MVATTPLPHPLFHAFEEFDGWSAAGFESSYFGAQFRDWLFTGQPKGSTERRRVHVSYPPVAEEYFEWIALLGAVASAKDQFCMLELGAGWGRWSVYAAMLCRQRRLPFTLVAVEPEPSHFQWLQMVFQDNGIDPREHHLCEAAVVPSGHVVRLAGIDDPLHEYGHYVSAGLKSRLRVRRGRHAVREVKAVSLRELLIAHPKIDLIDMDIQGMEDKVIRSVPAEDLDGVRIMHIGTHSRGIEVRLRRMFRRAGWHNAFSFPCYSETRTPFGQVRFEDGVETWVHPEAKDVLELLLNEKRTA